MVRHLPRSRQLFQHIKGDRPMNSTINTKHEEQRLRSVSLKNFLRQDFPSRTPLLKGLLFRQDLAMIYGPRGVGKTFVAFELAYAVASGGKFGPWRAPKPQKVLLLDGEMAARPLQRRAERVHDTENRAAGLRNLYIVTPD